MIKEVRLVPQKSEIGDILEDELLDAPNGFFTKISVVDVIETSENENILEDVCNKLRVGGELKITGIDGYVLCRKVYLGDLQLSSTIFKHINNIYSLTQLKNYFEQNNYSIIFAGLDNGKYTIQVVKHGN